MRKRDKRYLTCALDIRGADVEGDVGVIRGYASVFNVLVEAYREIVKPGAFKQTVKHLKGVWPVYKYHDPKKWLGNNRHAEEDKKGLFVESELLINDVPEAAQEYALIKHTAALGRDAQLSIGFWPVKWTYDKKEDLTELTEVAMGEHSTIPPGFAANPKADITETRNSWLTMEPFTLHGFETRPGWDETDDYIRYRVRDPEQFEKIRTIVLVKKKPRVMATYGKLKGEDKWLIQALLFPKEDDWTLAKAKSWLKEHPDAKRSDDNIYIPDSLIIDEKIALLLGLTCDLQGGDSLLASAAAEAEDATGITEADIHSVSKFLDDFTRRIRA